MLSTNSPSQRSRDAVNKAKNIAKNLLELKYPDEKSVDALIEKTATLEIKFKHLIEDDIVFKIKEMDFIEVGILFLQFFFSSIIIQVVCIISA